MRLEGQETREENILGITELTIMKMGDGEKNFLSDKMNKFPTSLVMLIL